MFRSVRFRSDIYFLLQDDTIRTIRQWDDMQLPFYQAQTTTNHGNNKKPRGIDLPCVTFILLFQIPSSHSLVGTGPMYKFSFKIKTVRNLLLRPVVLLALCFVYFSVIFVGRKFMCLRSRDAESVYKDGGERKVCRMETDVETQILFYSILKRRILIKELWFTTQTEEKLLHKTVKLRFDHFFVDLLQDKKLMSFEIRALKKLISAWL